MLIKWYFTGGIGQFVLGNPIPSVNAVHAFPNISFNVEHAFGDLYTNRFSFHCPDDSLKASLISNYKIFLPVNGLRKMNNTFR